MELYYEGMTMNFDFITGVLGQSSAQVLCYSKDFLQIF